MKLYYITLETIVINSPMSHSFLNYLSFFHGPNDYKLQNKWMLKLKMFLFFQTIRELLKVIGRSVMNNLPWEAALEGYWRCPPTPSPPPPPPRIKGCCVGVLRAEGVEWWWGGWVGVCSAVEGEEESAMSSSILRSIGSICTLPHSSHLPDFINNSCFFLFSKILSQFNKPYKVAGI